MRTLYGIGQLNSINRIILRIFLVLALNLNGQKGGKYDVWISERYVSSIGIRNDSTPDNNYLNPIAGIKNPFGNLIIMPVASDEMSWKSKNNLFNGKKVIEVLQFRSFFSGADFEKNGIVERDKIKAYISKEKEKLILQIVYNAKIIDTIYFVNHYNDYYFRDLRKDLQHLYSIRHNHKK